MRINNNLSALSANKNIKKNSARVSDSIKKLSSGLKIDSFDGDVAGGSISEKMRGQIRGLNQACRNIQDGVSLIHTGDGPTQEIQGILNRMRELSVQGANDTNAYVDRDALQKELDELVKEIDNIAQSTNFNGINLLDSNWQLRSAQKNLQDNSLDLDHNQTSKIVVEYERFRKDGADGKTPPTVTPVGNPNVTQSSITDVTHNTSYITGNNDCVISNYKSETYPDMIAEQYQVDDTITKTVDTTITTEITNVTDAATTLSNKVSNGGYPQFETSLGDSAISLYCAMTKFSVNIDGTHYDSIYNSSYVTQQTTFSSDNSVAKTVFTIDGVEITQTISTVDNNNVGKADTFDIDIQVKNITQPAEDRNVSIKLAFDALNGLQSYSVDNGSNFSAVNTNNSVVWKPASGNEIIKFQDGASGLENVTINFKQKSGTGYESADIMVLDNIETLYYDWDYAPDSSSTSNHAAAGIYWENMSITSGDTKKLGVAYGDTEFFVDVYETKTTTDIDTYIETKREKYDETIVYRANSLIIQTGANQSDDLKLPLHDLSAHMLEVDSLSVMTHKDAAAAITKIGAASNFVSSMRSLWGAYENRLGYTNSRNEISSENLVNAESRIRDVDMAKEITAKVSGDIVQQASVAMLSQANSLPQAVLQLIQ